MLHLFNRYAVVIINLQKSNPKDLLLPVGH